MNKLFFYLLPFVFLSCNNSNSKKEVKTPPGYDLNNPEKFLLPDGLNEVSGIGFYNGKSDTLYAEQDEEARLYYLHPGDSKASSVKFGKKGDYEDMAIINDKVIFMRSDGVLFSFPFSEVKQEEVSTLGEWKDLVPSGEYEGFFADPSDNKLYVLCKQCKGDKTSEAVSAYILQLQPDGNIVQSGSQSISVKDIEKLSGEKKLKFQPSALARNPQTKEWYILSSVNKMLVIASSDWKIQEVYPLNPATFRQPEGMAFDGENNLYISNEGDDISKSNVLKFAYKK